MLSEEDLKQLGNLIDARNKTLETNIKAEITAAVKPLATKQDVEETVEAAKAELKADIQDSKASLMQQAKRQGKWIEAIAEKTDTPNPNKN